MFVYEKVSEIESMKHRIFRGVMSNIFRHLSLPSAGSEDETRMCLIRELQIVGRRRPAPVIYDERLLLSRS